MDSRIISISSHFHEGDIANLGQRVAAQPLVRKLERGTRGEELTKITINPYRGCIIDSHSVGE